MKYLVFYDLAIHQTISEVNQLSLLFHFVESQSINLNFYVTATKHTGTPLTNKVRPNGQMDISGMKILSKSIIQQVNTIFQYRNVWSAFLGFHKI